MTHKETALDYFGRKFHCSQSVLAYKRSRGSVSERFGRLKGGH